MDGQSAIERNRAALKRIVASLVDMAGLDMGQSAVGNRQSETAAGDAAPKTRNPTPDCRLPTAAILPRHLYRFILRLLRPAEAAARRLIIAASRGLTVPAPKLPCETEPKPQTMEPFMRKLGLAVMMPPGRHPGSSPAKRGRGTMRSTVEGAPGRKPDRASGPMARPRGAPAAKRRTARERKEMTSQG